MNGKLRLRRTLAMLLLGVLLSCTVQNREKEVILLNTRLDLKAYGSERLESVISRMESKTGIQIGFSLTDLSPFTAKYEDYRNATIQSILNRQLEGTGLHYRVSKNRKISKHLELFRLQPDKGSTRP